MFTTKCLLAKAFTENENQLINLKDHKLVKWKGDCEICIEQN